MDSRIPANRWAGVRILSAKRVASSRCPQPSTFTANLPAVRIDGRVRDLRSRDTNTCGGRRDTEVNAFTVMPSGPSGPGQVTTVTPVANRRISVRNLSGSTAGLSQVSQVAAGMVSTSWMWVGSLEGHDQLIRRPTSSRPVDAYLLLAH